MGKGLGGEREGGEGGERDETCGDYPYSSMERKVFFSFIIICCDYLMGRRRRRRRMVCC